MRVNITYQDTRSNNEDFAITPYLFGVIVKGEVLKVIGLGLCWGWYSFSINICKGLPKMYPTFKVIK